VVLCSASDGRAGVPLRLARRHCWRPAGSAGRPAAQGLSARLTQASKSELRAALAQRGACDLDGRWQVPSQEYAASLLALLLLTAQHQGWPLTSLPAGEAGALLSQDGHDPRYVLSGPTGHA